MQTSTHTSNGHALAAALGYAAHGWPPVPVTGKRPSCGDAWQLQATSDPAQVELLFRHNDHDGVGVVLGESAGIIDVECDNDQAEQTLLELFAGTIPTTPTFQSTRGKHRLFNWTDDLPEPTKAVFKIGQLEFRTGNGDKAAQTVFPPSNGRTWIVSPDDAAVAVISAEVIDRIKMKYAAKKQKRDKPTTRGEHRQGESLDVAAWLLSRGAKLLGTDTTPDGAARWFIECPGITSHTNENGVRDCCVTQEPSGRLGGSCFHQSCGMDSWQAISTAIGKPTRDDYPPARSINQRPTGEQPEPPDDYDEHNEWEPSVLPEVLLPGGTVTITAAGTRFGNLLAATGRIFRRGDSVSNLSHDQDGQPILTIIKPAGFASLLESVAKLRTIKKTKDGYEIVPTICYESPAKLILSASEFLNCLPAINVVSPCPVLVERDGQLITITGYDRESGVLAAGKTPTDISLDDARELLSEIIADFKYTTPSDRARHLASIITPALVLGGLLGGRAPVDLTEANESQAGKGYRNKLTSAIFNMKLRTITQRKSGVGGIEESFSGALVSGAAFICLDNLRDKVDLPSLESFLTEDTFQARVPYSGDVEIDARRIVVMLTSNRAEITTDLANRSCITRILKQSDGYQFHKYSEGDILDHVRAHQSLYLGAVFAVVKAWHVAGKPRTIETRHDFRKWSTTLDWIVQNLLGCPPLLDGHRETQKRMTTPILTWLRDVGLAVARSEKMEQWLRTYEILDLAESAGLAIPGVKEDMDLDDDATRAKVLRVIGKKIGVCFRDDKATIDDVTINRRHTLDHESRQRPEYQFASGAVTPF